MKKLLILCLLMTGCVSNLGTNYTTGTLVEIKYIASATILKIINKNSSSSETFIRDYKKSAEYYKEYLGKKVKIEYLAPTGHSWLINGEAGVTTIEVIN
jgi:hypothetical protein